MTHRERACEWLPLHVVMAEEGRPVVSKRRAVLQRGPNTRRSPRWSRRIPRALFRVLEGRVGHQCSAGPDRGRTRGKPLTTVPAWRRWVLQDPRVLVVLKVQSNHSLRPIPQTNLVVPLQPWPRHPHRKRMTQRLSSPSDAECACRHGRTAGPRLRPESGTPPRRQGNRTGMQAP